MRVLGMMSGTSVDAIDVAVVDLEPGRVPSQLNLHVLGHTERPFPSEVRRTALDLISSESCQLAALTAMNFTLGRIFARAALDALEVLRLPLQELDLIASHGQTIYHLAEPGRMATLQLGEPAVIATETGITTVADFRVADVSVGGEGAPLVSFFDVLFFGGDAHTRAIQNIGGIANVTFVSGNAEAIAFDTGPGNALIDFGARELANQPFDLDGALARAGQVDEALVEETLTHPYFRRSPPKSTGRELFGDGFAHSFIERARRRGLTPEDIMATLTAVTAESIARAYRDFGPTPIKEVIVSGGGVRNLFLMDELRRRLGDIRVSGHDQFGIAADAKEAVAFALLGYETLHGRPSNMPGCTGAARPAVLGKIVPGVNYVALMERVFRQGEQTCRPTKVLLMPSPPRQ